MVFKLRRGFFLSFSLSDTPHYENVPFEVPFMGVVQVR